MTATYRFTRTIGYMGLIPFICGAIISTNILPITRELHTIITLFSIHYASIILSFMGGVLWGFEISKPELLSKKMLVIILVPPLWAAISLLLPIRCFLLALGFLIVYQLDYIFTKNQKSPAWWLKLRAPLTGFVVISLIIMGFNE